MRLSHSRCCRLLAGPLPLAGAVRCPSTPLRVVRDTRCGGWSQAALSDGECPRSCWVLPASALHVFILPRGLNSTFCSLAKPPSFHVQAASVFHRDRCSPSSPRCRLAEVHAGFQSSVLLSAPQFVCLKEKSDHSMICCNRQCFPVLSR